MTEILEIAMILCFGASWPFNVYRSYRARTAKGKSLPFLILIEVGYLAGIASKFMNPVYMADFHAKWYVVFFYLLNFSMVAVDLGLYVRNRRLDLRAERRAPDAVA